MIFCRSLLIIDLFSDEIFRRFFLVFSSPLFYLLCQLAHCYCVTYTDTPLFALFFPGRQQTFFYSQNLADPQTPAIIVKTRIPSFLYRNSNFFVLIHPLRHLNNQSNQCNNSKPNSTSHSPSSKKLKPLVTLI